MTLTNRELAIILAALHQWQQTLELLESTGVRSMELDNIASAAGPALEPDEIDELSEYLKTHPILQDHKRLTANKQQEYVDGGGTRCPFCKEYALDAEPMHLLSDGSNDYLQECRVICRACGEVWEDQYALSSMNLDIDQGKTDPQPTVIGPT